MHNRADRHALARTLLARVGLDPEHVERYPHEFSGGQRQRIGIARALALNPEFIVCDEPVSALDVSAQGQIVNLLKDLQDDLGLTYLFIAHNLALTEHISDRVAVMYLGKMVELSETEQMCAKPAHPYTAALLSADLGVSRRTAPRRLVLSGDIPSPADIPSGCRFHTRCWLREQLRRPGRCETEEPQLREVRPNQLAACHFSDEMSSQRIAAAAG
jgi:oligopeptide/dipeptide ABC transporter ATP-binding protein